LVALGVLGGMLAPLPPHQRLRLGGQLREWLLCHLMGQWRRHWGGELVRGLARPVTPENATLERFFYATRYACARDGHHSFARLIRR